MLKPNKRERPLFRVPELLWFLLQSVLHQSVWLQHADQCPAHKADATNTGRDRVHQASSGTSPFPDYYTLPESSAPQDTEFIWRGNADCPGL